MGHSYKISECNRGRSKSKYDIRLEASHVTDSAQCSLGHPTLFGPLVYLYIAQMSHKWRYTHRI